MFLDEIPFGIKLMCTKFYFFYFASFSQVLSPKFSKVREPSNTTSKFFVYGGDPTSAK